MDFDRLVKSDLDKRIKATQSYFSLFEKKLTAVELDRLILGKKESDKIYEPIVSTNELARNLLIKATKMSWVFAYIPFVKSISICNYLSFDIAEKDSDIDLLIIAEKNRIYLCRFYMTILLHLMRMRRHSKKVSGRFCLSFYLSEEHLNLAKIEQNPYDIYLAYWFLGLKELANFDSNIWEMLLVENEKWLQRYFSSQRLRRESPATLSEKRLLRRLVEWLYKGWLGDKFEALLKWFFEKRALKLTKSLPENASIVVSDEMQKFHNNDRRSLFRRSWEEALNRLGLFE